MLLLALLLGMVTMVANLLGSYIPTMGWVKAHHTSPILGFGGGFVLAAALAEVVPESLEGGAISPFFIVLGYLLLYLAGRFSHKHDSEHGVQVTDPPDTPPGLGLSRTTGLVALLGFNLHDFLDGIAIGAALLTSRDLGFLVFLAVLLHEVPAGFIVGSMMRASGHSKTAALLAGTSIGLITIVGILLPFWFRGFHSDVTFAFLGLSGGSFIYIGASELIPRAMQRPTAITVLSVLLGFALFLGTSRLLGSL